MAQKRMSGRIAGIARRLGLEGRRPVLALLAAGAVLSAVLALTHILARPAFTIEGGSQTAQETAEAPAETSHPKPVLVDIDGAVAEPGVFDLSGTTLRVRDAVDAAGGLLDSADTASLNLAAPVADGAKIHVPSKEEAAPAAAAPPAGSGQPASAPAAPSGLVNINTATAAELETLPGIGASTARAIVQERTEHGPFASKEDLMRVTGIGEKKYAKLEAGICV